MMSFPLWNAYVSKLSKRKFRHLWTCPNNLLRCYRHWFYEDFIREENPKLPSLPLKKFSAMLFHACPLLHQWSDDHEQAFNNFMQYKTRVPVCGAIMLNETWEKVRSPHSSDATSAINFLFPLRPYSVFW